MPYHCLVHYVKQCPTKVIVECGVSKGGSMKLIVDNMPYLTNVYGFDSFKGLQDKYHTEGIEDKTTGNFKADEKQVREKFKGYPVTIIAGEIPESLYPIHHIGILHIDVDYYKTYIDVLNHFYPMVAEGGIIIGDDTPSLQYRGSKRAMEEFFKGKESIIEWEDESPNERKMYVIKGA